MLCGRVAQNKLFLLERPEKYALFSWLQRSDATLRKLRIRFWDSEILCRRKKPSGMLLTGCRNITVAFMTIYLAFI